MNRGFTMNPIFTGMLAFFTWLYGISNGKIVGRVAGLPVLLLTTTGRKSGKQRTTPLGFLEHDGAYVVIASNAGSDRHPNWFFNLSQNPNVKLRIRDKTISANAKILGPDVRKYITKQDDEGKTTGVFGDGGSPLNAARISKTTAKSKWPSPRPRAAVRSSWASAVAGSGTPAARPSPRASSRSFCIIGTANHASDGIWRTNGPRYFTIGDATTLRSSASTARATARNDRGLGARLQGVQHFGLTVQNMERAFSFYTEVLGGTEVMRDGDFHGERIHNTLLTDQEIEARMRQVNPRALGVPDLRGGAQRLDVRFIQFDNVVIELLKYRDAEQTLGSSAAFAEPLEEMVAAEGDVAVVAADLSLRAGDHRMAMVLAVAGLVAPGGTLIRDSECIQTSFPGFAERLGIGQKLYGGIGRFYTSFTRGLDKDRDAVTAALTLPYSNGPTEGLNLCVKRVKRCGHGFKRFEHSNITLTTGQSLELNIALELGAVTDCSVESSALSGATVPNGVYDITGESVSGNRDFNVETSSGADSRIDVSTTSGGVLVTGG